MNKLQERLAFNRVYCTLDHVKLLTLVRSSGESEDKGVPGGGDCTSIISHCPAKIINNNRIVMK